MIIIPVEDPDTFPDGACEAVTEPGEVCRHKAHWMIDGYAYCSRHASLTVWLAVLAAKGLKPHE